MLQFTWQILHKRLSQGNDGREAKKNLGEMCVDLWAWQTNNPTLVQRCITRGDVIYGINVIRNDQVNAIQKMINGTSTYKK